MKNLFIAYELAVTAKEKGFNEKCFGVWNRKVLDLDLSIETNSEMAKHHPENYVIAPVYQQIVDWFREKHSIYINQCVVIGEEEIQFSVTCNNKKSDDYADTFGRFTSYWTEYYKGFNKAIEEAFKLI